MKHILLFSAFALSACSNIPLADTQNMAPQKPNALKLYALDCGKIDMLDLSHFDVGGAYDGRTYKSVNTCFLIRHAKGDLLWDTGLPDSLYAIEDGIRMGPFHAKVKNTLDGQLGALGVTPDTLDFLSLSHSHFDHVGNASQYASATFIVNAQEKDQMFGEEARKAGDQFLAYGALEQATTITFSGTYDVFGDGTVSIIHMPGHTIGHSILKIDLANTGTVVLTGDLYHFNEAREKRTVPTGNFDKEQTRQSMDKFEALAKRFNARVIIQHSAEDFETLPKFPEFLD